MLQVYTKQLFAKIANINSNTDRLDKIDSSIAAIKEAIVNNQQNDGCVSCQVATDKAHDLVKQTKIELAKCKADLAVESAKLEEVQNLFSIISTSSPRDVEVSGELLKNKLKAFGDLDQSSDDPAKQVRAMQLALAMASIELDIKTELLKQKELQIAEMSSSETEDVDKADQLEAIFEVLLIISDEVEDIRNSIAINDDGDIKYNELLERYNIVCDDNDNLRADNDNLRNDNNNLKDEIDQYKNELDRYKSKNEKLIQEKQNNMIKFNNVDDMIEIQQKEVEILKSKLDDDKIIMQELREKNKELEDWKRDVNAKSSSAKNEELNDILSLEKELKECYDIIDLYQAELKEREQLIDDLEKEKLVLQSEKKELDDLIDECSILITEAEAKLADKQDQIDQLIQKLSVYENNNVDQLVEELQNTIDQQTDRINALNQELKSKVAAVSDKEMKEIMNENRKLQEQVRDLSIKLENEKNQSQEYAELVDSLKTTNYNDQIEMKKLSKQIIDLMLRIDELNKVLHKHTLYLTSHGINIDQETQLFEEMDDLRAEVISKTQIIDEKDQIIQDKEQIIHDHLAEIHDKSLKIDELGDRLTQAESDMNEFEQDLGEIAISVDKLFQEKEQISQEYQDLQEDHEQILQKHEQVLQENDNLKQLMSNANNISTIPSSSSYTPDMQNILLEILKVCKDNNVINNEILSSLKKQLKDNTGLDNAKILELIAEIKKQMSDNTYKSPNIENNSELVGQLQEQIDILQDNLTQQIQQNKIAEQKVMMLQEELKTADFSDADMVNKYNALLQETSQQEAVTKQQINQYSVLYTQSQETNKILQLRLNRLINEKQLYNNGSPSNILLSIIKWIGLTIAIILGFMILTIFISVGFDNSVSGNWWDSLFNATHAAERITNNDINVAYKKETKYQDTIKDLMDSILSFLYGGTIDMKDVKFEAMASWKPFKLISYVFNNPVVYYLCKGLDYVVVYLNKGLNLMFNNDISQTIIRILLSAVYLGGLMLLIYFIISAPSQSEEEDDASE